MAHTFNPSTREVEMRSYMAEQREYYKVEEDRNSRFSLRLCRDGILSDDLWGQDHPLCLSI